MSNRGQISHMAESPTGCCYQRVAVPRVVVPAIVVPGQLYSHYSVMGWGGAQKSYFLAIILGPLPTKSVISLKSLAGGLGGGGTFESLFIYWGWG